MNRHRDVSMAARYSTEHTQTHAPTEWSKYGVFFYYCSLVYRYTGEKSARCSQAVI